MGLHGLLDSFTFTSLLPLFYLDSGESRFLRNVDISICVTSHKTVALNYEIEIAGPDRTNTSIAGSKPFHGTDVCLSYYPTGKERGGGDDCNVTSFCAKLLLGF
jgi:hypothetical protein